MTKMNADTSGFMSFRTIFLNDVKLTQEFYWVYQQYKDKVQEGVIPNASIRRLDFVRWVIAMNTIEESDDLLDIGIGGGQFPNAAMRSGRFRRVRGVDRRPHSMLQNFTNFEFDIFDITKEPSEALRTTTVTCMECIEHIPDVAFDKAVLNLKYLAKRQLIVTVPFLEDEPLPSYHFQRFTAERLKELFPGGELTLMAMKDGRIHWAMVDWRP